MTRWARSVILAAAAALAACGRPEPAAPTGMLIVTQVPAQRPAPDAGADILDARYPAGSRVVAIPPPYRIEDASVLSSGLSAAGSPVVSPDGTRVLFVARESEGGFWQVYEARPGDGGHRRRTEVRGGAMDPAFVAGGDFVFASPVPRADGGPPAADSPALSVQPADGSPRRITFGTAGATDPTVLPDGRILFVSAMPAGGLEAAPRLALFTVNTDGTGIAPFAAQHQGAPGIRRPRWLPDGRVAFVASASPRDAASGGRAEEVRTARPFLSRSTMPRLAGRLCQAVEAHPDGGLLAALGGPADNGGSPPGSFGIARLGPDPSAAPETLADDPAWEEVEAVFALRTQAPAGHPSIVDPARKTGILLCLDANRTTIPALDGVEGTRADRVRFTAAGADGTPRILGEVSLKEDGSFLVEVPADLPLGFEALDRDGRVLRRLPPFVWVRPGEIRSCLGCHEPHGFAPRNHRPLAALAPPVIVGDPASSSSAAGKGER